MNFEDIYIIINFETDDLAEQMIREEDEKYPPVSDYEHVSNLLAEEDLSFQKLEASFATIQNVNKKLYIQLEANNVVYRPSLLERLELSQYVNYANTFNNPKKVQIIEVSTQVGGIIDTNYGIKFKIKRLEKKTEKINIHCNNNHDSTYDALGEDSVSKVFFSGKKKDHGQAMFYIKAMCKIESNDSSYNDSIVETIEMIKTFYQEGLKQSEYLSHDIHTNTYNIFYKKESRFFFGCYTEKYYAVVFLEDKYLVCNLVDGEVNILCETKDMQKVHIDIINYNEGLKTLL